MLDKKSRSCRLPHGWWDPGCANKILFVDIDYIEDQGAVAPLVVFADMGVVSVECDGNRISAWADVGIKFEVKYNVCSGRNCLQVLLVMLFLKNL